MSASGGLCQFWRTLAHVRESHLIGDDSCFWAVGHRITILCMLSWCSFGIGLKEIVPNLSEWSEALFYEAKDAFTAIKEISCPHSNGKLDEVQLEEQWVQPVLQILAYDYAVQVKIRYREHGHRKPDYMFFRSETEARAITNQIYAPNEIAHALAVRDASKLSEALDHAHSLIETALN